MLTDEAKRRIAALKYNHPDNLIEPVRQTLDEMSPEEIRAVLVFHERLRAKLAAQGAQDVQGYIRNTASPPARWRPRLDVQLLLTFLARS